MINEKLPAFYYGGDYNPDQWPEEIYEEDMRLFKEANINIVTLPVFSWAKLQPSEDVYDFTWLDKILDLVYKNGIYVCLATSTAAQPAWMSKKYPEILPVDFEGRKRKHGGRVNFCPNSQVYRKFSVKLVEELAKRYQNHPALLIWHVGNEYGNYCYCDHCEAEFRKWLQEKYQTIEAVNKAWNMSFWGHTLYGFDEVTAPSGLSEVWKEGWRERTTFQGMVLDYYRFMSESSLNCYRGEYEVIKKYTPHIPVTTNLMGTFKPLDYFKWAEYMDVVSWDNYPSLTDPWYKTALRHDLMRGLKDGMPFMLMEQTPSQQNWQAYNSTKRPGVLKLQSYQTIAHGADSIMYFQLRRSIGACEKYHSAVIDHVGTNNTRVFRECRDLGEELKSLGSQILGSRVHSKVGIIFDWENWWAIELSSGPSSDLHYIAEIEKYYKAFFDLNIPVDFIKPESDFSQYDLIVAPVLYMVKTGVAKRLEEYVQNGGTFITTFFSGYVNENDLVTVGGYPGELRQLLGIWVEEIDALFPHMKNSIVMNQSVYSCNLLCDVLHPEGATVLATYGSDYYQGTPALTVNHFGNGKAFYVATSPDDLFMADFVKGICDELQIKPIMEPVSGVEVTKRSNEQGEFTFIMNYNETDVSLDLKGTYLDLVTNEEKTNTVTLKAKDIMILRGSNE